MQRATSNASEGFWTTIELLADRGRRHSSGDRDDVVTPDPPRAKSTISFAHPHVRARLEKHMGSNLVRLTDKTYMNELEERIRAVNEENLHKRISSRVLDEMERLKRLILVGKTPLKECPPELFHHPVFVFWRMVNREVARASKKRADAYYRKLKASQKIDQGIDEEVESVATADDGEQLTPEQLLAKCREELELMKQVDIEHGIRFTDEQYSQLKYETNDVKTLKNLTTVEELYALADKIIGTKKQDMKQAAKEAQQHKEQQEAVQQDKEQQDTAQKEKDQQGKVQQD
ncbi:uncharacterized protein LOC121727562 isoform X2 [Aricia agestis]|uniref:uncharacterized protein LOC121727562 isoform X2 n=1 Tax=Aricia agestis TaxID=91739 RepID=UPI001C20961D|nr:uncharacterized protein LOC121727562 isoform X2 [Aricia agestis]